MTVLSMVQDACDIIGIQRPTSLVGSTNQASRQLLALANVEGKSLAQRFPFQELVKEGSFTTLAAELQSTLAAAAPGFNWDFYNTFWNETQQVPLGGALTPQEWRLFKASVTTGPYSDFYIKDKSIYMIPAPAAGETVKFEYVSNYWCESSGGTDQVKWAADTDVGILPEDLMMLGLIWRWKKQKGLDYSEDFREYEVQVNNKMARSGGGRAIDMTGTAKDYLPGIVVPQGSWSP